MIQRVSEACVVVAGEVVGEIGSGLVALVGVERGDDERDASVLAAKVSGLRVFGDGAGGFERSVVEAGGAVLVVSQFTLPASLKRGRRPSFTLAAPQGEADPLVSAVVDHLRRAGLEVATGRFGAKMSVRLVNEGPATFIIDVRGGKVR